jgi:hypothetical protein
VSPETLWTLTGDRPRVAGVVGDRRDRDRVGLVAEAEDRELPAGIVTPAIA